MFRSMARRETKDATKLRLQPAARLAAVGTQALCHGPKPKRFSKVDHRPFSPRLAVASSRGLLSVEKNQLGRRRGHYDQHHDRRRRRRLLARRESGGTYSEKNRSGAVKHPLARPRSRFFSGNLLAGQQVRRAAILLLAKCFTETTHLKADSTDAERVGRIIQLLGN